MVENKFKITKLMLGTFVTIPIGEYVYIEAYNNRNFHGVVLRCIHNPKLKIQIKIKFQI